MKRFYFLFFCFSNFAFGQVRDKPQHDPPETINRYAAALAFDICTNSITVSDATEFNTGDTVLIIQMKGAIIDTSNTPAFGSIIDYGNAGNYEFNFISGKTGNQLTLQNKLTRDYDIPDGVVQLVRVPKYKSALFTGGLTCDVWDGAKGGIVAVYSSISLTSVEDIYVSGRGFRGAAGYNASNSAGNCGQNNYYYPASSNYAALRGESIGSVSQNLSKGKGRIAGGGGGGNSHNSGGGGGGNGGAGGRGGYQSDSCNAAPFDNGGVGGAALLYNNSVNKIFMGSGGGAGHIDNAGVTVPGGGNGGGIIIIITEELGMLEELIHANGDDAGICGAPNCNDGSGAGGAGGTILLSYTNVVGNLSLETRGGKGADTYGPVLPGGRAGPGGGGGGGVTFLTGNSFPANVTAAATGGLNGVIQEDANNAWGATAGSDGIALFDLVLPWSTVPFKPNIDSVRFQHSVNYCNNIQFAGSGFTNAYPVDSWEWHFGDGGTSDVQNPTHNYNAVGNYDVKLIVTDINGCKDSIIKTINTGGPMQAEAGTDTAFCVSGPKTLMLNGSGTGSYAWSPAGVLDNSTIANPTATISTTTTFYLTMSNGTGCSAVDSVTVTLKPTPVVKTLSDTTICKNAVLVLSTNGAINYTWSPGIYVSDSTIASPQYLDTVGRQLVVTGTALNGCMAKDSINVAVRNPTLFIAPESKTICQGASVQLNGNNGNLFQYLWTPAAYLNDAGIEDPVAAPPVTTTYTVKITDDICKTDSSFAVVVTVVPIPRIIASKSNDLTCTKPFAQLQVSGASNYRWTPAYGLNNDTIPNPIANPAVTTTYLVTATDSAICNGRDSITVVADFKKHGIILPNSFTPNNDGLNDCFGITYYRDVRDLSFIIYNRYGNVVFETKDPADCWNGNYNGKPAGPGSYVYFIRAKTLCGDVFMKDNFLLLR